LRYQSQTGKLCNPPYHKLALVQEWAVVYQRVWELGWEYRAPVSQVLPLA
jgi:hypothetical protein